MKTAKFLAFALAVAALSGVAGAQTAADRYLISAKAGGINYIQGNVVTVSADGVSSRVFKGDRLEAGDRLRTGAEGRAEVLLNPGSYVRLGSNAEFSLVDDSLDNLRLRVDRGSAMFEIYATKDFTVTVEAVGGNVVFTRSGIYRVDASNPAAVRVDVFDGRASLSSNSKVSAGSGRSLMLAGGNASVASFDRKKADELSGWSKSRSKTLAEATASLKNDDVRSSLIDSFNMGRWNMFNTFGLWVYDWRMQRYCFLPFGFGWQTPYGYFYGPGIYWFNLPPIIFNNPNPTGTTTGNTNPSPAPSGGQDGTKTRARALPPAYTKIESDRTNTPVRATQFPSVFEDTGARVRVSSPVVVAAPAESSAPAATGSRPTRP
jgi:hypothetical protein